MHAEQTTRDLTDEGNSIIQSVSDIVALPQLDDSRFMDQVKLAENHKEETIEDLHSFDRSETNRLLPIEQEVATLRRIVNEMNGMFQAGELSLTQYQPNQLTNKLAASMSISQLGSFLSHGISSVPDGEEADENVNSCAAPEVETEDVEEGNDTGKELGSVALDFIPIVSNFKSGAEALMGKDLITGRELAGWERGVLVAGIFGGPIVKGAKRAVQWGGDLLGKVKNVLNPDRIKETFDLIFKKTTQGYDTFRNSAAALMKKIGDIEIPTPSFAYAGGVKGNSTTVAETLEQAKDTIVEMAGKVKDGVSKGVNNVKTRLPRSNGKWVGEPGNGKWYSDMPEVNKITSGEGVDFVNGRPNFTPWSKGSIKFKKGMLDGSKKDFNLVYKKIMQLKGFTSMNQAKAWLKEKGITPHHKSATEIELIPTDLHGNVPHIGSASDLRGGKYNE